LDFENPKIYRSEIQPCDHILKAFETFRKVQRRVENVIFRHLTQKLKLTFIKLILKIRFAKENIQLSYFAC
jgi:hypothetical protein